MPVEKAQETASAWMQQTYNAQGAIICMALLSLLSGVIQAIVLKWQNRSMVVQCELAGQLFDETYTDCKSKHFTQAFLQTMFMFAGECVALPFYFLVEKPPNMAKTVANVGDEEQGVEEAASPEPVQGSLWWWVTPAPLDFAECCLGCIAVSITYASTVQMLHNFMVISSAVFTMLILRRPLRVHEWAGCLIVTAALILSSIPAIQHPEVETDSSKNLHWLGILFAVISTCIHSLQNIWEEALFQKSNISANLAVGLEGVTGVILTAASLPLVELTGYESPRQGLTQLGKSSKLRWGMFIYSISSLLNNVCGIAVTKWASGLLRCLFMSVRAPTIWIIEMYLRWNVFDWCNFTSMFVLIIGLALYMYVFPFTKLADKARYALMLPITFGVLHEELPRGEVELVPGDKQTEISTPATNTPSLVI